MLCTYASLRGMGERSVVASPSSILLIANLWMPNKQQRKKPHKMGNRTPLQWQEGTHYNRFHRLCCCWRSLTFFFPWNMLVKYELVKCQSVFFAAANMLPRDGLVLVTLLAFLAILSSSCL